MKGMEVMRSKLISVTLPFMCLLGIGLFVNNNLSAKETLEDGIIGLTKAEVNEKFGKPTYLYCEEEPFRRYAMVTPEEESILRAQFLYDVSVHDFYYLKRNGSNCEFRFYYGEDTIDGQKVWRVKEYFIKFLDGPVALGKIVDLVPEFKPAYGKAKVYQERLINLNNIRLTFVTPEINELSKHILCDNEPEKVSANSMVKEVIVSVDGEYRIGKTAHAFGTKLIANPLQ